MLSTLILLFNITDTLQQDHVGPRPRKSRPPRSTADVFTCMAKLVESTLFPRNLNQYKTDEST